MNKTFPSSGSAPNPHALAALVKASENHAIVASRDIVDVQGVTLWPQGQPVSASLQQRLRERRLQNPLELCLEAANGVNLASLSAALRDFLDSDHPLSAALRPWRRTLVGQLRLLPLHPVVQLMLTASVASRPGTLLHAVAGMALAGAMMARQQGSREDVRLAMLGGLLHDIGEVYIHPRYLDYTQALDVSGHKYLVIHPRVGQLLLAHLTDYPDSLAVAVGEHHERLDRSGYPARLSEPETSELGRLLAVVEVTLGLTRWPHAALARASFALRAVPGEFDTKWSSFVVEAAAAAQEDLSPTGLEGSFDQGLDLQLADIDALLRQARHLAHEMQEQRRTARVTDVVNHSLDRLQRLRAAWHALGSSDSPAAKHTTAAERFQVQLAEADLSQRLRGFQRECLLLSDRLSEAEKLRLSPLWQGLFHVVH